MMLNRGYFYLCSCVPVKSIPRICFLRPPTARTPRPPRRPKMSSQRHPSKDSSELSCQSKLGALQYLYLIRSVTCQRAFCYFLIFLCSIPLCTKMAHPRPLFRLFIFGLFTHQYNLTTNKC